MQLSVIFSPLFASFYLLIAYFLVAANVILTSQNAAASELLPPNGLAAAQRFVERKMTQWKDSPEYVRWQGFWYSERPCQRNRLSWLGRTLEELTPQLCQPSFVLEGQSFDSRGLWNALFNELLHVTRTEMRIALQGLALPHEACGCTEFEDANWNAAYGYRVLGQKICEAGCPDSPQVREIFAEAMGAEKRLAPVLREAKAVNPFVGKGLALVLPLAHKKEEAAKVKERATAPASPSRFIGAYSLFG